MVKCVTSGTTALFPAIYMLLCMFLQLTMLHPVSYILVLVDSISDAECMHALECAMSVETVSAPQTATFIVQAATMPLQ